MLGSQWITGYVNCVLSARKRSVCEKVIVCSCERAHKSQWKNNRRHEVLSPMCNVCSETPRMMRIVCESESVQTNTIIGIEFIGLNAATVWMNQIEPIKNNTTICSQINRESSTVTITEEHNESQLFWSTLQWTFCSALFFYWLSLCENFVPITVARIKTHPRLSDKEWCLLLRWQKGTENSGKFKWNN